MLKEMEMLLQNYYKELNVRNIEKRRFQVTMQF